MRRRTPGWFVTLAVVCAAVATGPVVAQQLEIIGLQHRRAEDVIPVVQPLLAPGGTLSGIDNQLLIRTSPANLAEIRAALAAIDQPQRQLLITVGQGTVTDTTSARATVRGGSQQASLRNLSSVRTLEGTETWIAVGESVPFTTTTVTPGWNGNVQRSTSFRDVSTGFFATARLNGDLVTLEVSPRQQQFDRSVAGGTIETRGASTVVRGRLGEWLPVGSVQENSSGSQSGVLDWGRQGGSASYSAWVRVEAVP